MEVGPNGIPGSPVSLAFCPCTHEAAKTAANPRKTGSQRRRVRPTESLQGSAGIGSDVVDATHVPHLDPSAFQGYRRGRDACVPRVRHLVWADCRTHTTRCFLMFPGTSYCLPATATSVGNPAVVGASLRVVSVPSRVPREPQLQVTAHIRPLRGKDAVHHRVAHGAVLPRGMVADDAVPFRAQTLDRAL